MTHKRRSRIAHKLHQELWHWLANNPDQRKEDWPVWYKQSNRPIQEQQVLRMVREYSSLCFACYISDLNESCDSCPITWDTKMKNRCSEDDSSYMKWKRSKAFLSVNGYYSDVTLSALSIAKLPWNYDK